LKTNLAPKGDLITVPDGDDPESLLLGINLKLSWPAILERPLVDVAPIFIDIEFESGVKGHYRVRPDTLPDGIPIDTLVRAPVDIVNLSQGIKPARVRSLKLEGPGLTSFQDTIQLTWMRLTRVPAQN
jgi:hypothetical protein